MTRRRPLTEEQRKARRVYMREYHRRHKLGRKPEREVLARLAEMAITPEELAACGVVLPPKTQEGGR